MEIAEYALNVYIVNIHYKMYMRVKYQSYQFIQWWYHMHFTLFHCNIFTYAIGYLKRLFVNHALRRKPFSCRFSIANKQKNDAVKSSQCGKDSEMNCFCSVNKDTRLKWKRKRADRIIYEFAFRNFASLHRTYVSFENIDKHNTSGFSSLFFSFS